MQTSQNSIRVAGGAEKKHKSKCLLLHLSSLQQHDAGPGMGQVDAAAALEKCQICCCVLLHLRLTAYSVAMLLPFAFCLAASTDWLQASALELAYKHYKLFTFSPATRSKQHWPGSCSRFNWVFVRQGVGGCFFPRCSSVQFVLQSVLTRGHPSDSCGQFGQFTTRQWSAHTHRAWPVLCTAKLRSDGSSFILFSASLVVTISSILASEQVA